MSATDRATDGAPSASVRIDAFLAGLSEDFRRVLQALRMTIAAAAPEAVEAISYANPAFKYRGRPLVSYGAATNHCSLYVMSPAVMDAHHDELAAFETSKGTIRFQPSGPLPDDLVTRLVRARIAETDAARG
jgi:uncharacterized protein YdhG (YjbR/CyaY superfamily)